MSDECKYDIDVCLCECVCVCVCVGVSMFLWACVCEFVCLFGYVRDVLGEELRSPLTHINKHTLIYLHVSPLTSSHSTLSQWIIYYSLLCTLSLSLTHTHTHTHTNKHTLHTPHIHGVSRSVQVNVLSNTCKCVVEHIYKHEYTHTVLRHQEGRIRVSGVTM